MKNVLLLSVLGASWSAWGSHVTTSTTTITAPTTTTTTTATAALVLSVDEKTYVFNSLVSDGMDPVDAARVALAWQPPMVFPRYYTARPPERKEYDNAGKEKE